MRSGKVAVAIVVALLLLVAGAAAAQFLLPPRPPAGLADRPAESSFPIEETSYDDARTVQVAFEAGPDVSLSSPASGRVTESSCAPGAKIASGAIAGQVSGSTVLALYTSTPLWRPLSWGDTGPDVAALRQELNRLGAGIAESGAVDGALIGAVAARLVPEGTDPPKLDSVPVERIMWLPQTEVSMVSCDATLGTTIEAGATFGKVSGTLSGARVATLPADLAPGVRVLRVDGVTSQVDESGVVTSPEALMELAASPTVRKAAQAEEVEEAQLAGVLLLAEAAAVSAVPPATVFAVDGTSACLTSDGRDVAVKIVGSKLGKTYVVPVDDQGKLPESVDIPSKSDRKCKTT